MDHPSKENDCSWCPCDKSRGGQNGRDKSRGGQNGRTAENIPTTSRYSTDETNCDDICDCSSFLPGTKRNLKNSELNNTLLYPKSSKSGGGQQYLATQNESLLIEDTYDPGLIEDSVEGRKDFNAVSFGIFFEDIQHIPRKLPTKTPMSLLEAFHKRIDCERNHLLDATSIKNESRKLTVQSVGTFFSNKPKTNLNMALSNLYKAEALFEVQKTGQPVGNQVKNEELYDVNIRETTKPIVGGSPITVETFVGTTTPKKGAPKNDTKPKKKFVCF